MPFPIDDSGLSHYKDGLLLHCREIFDGVAIDALRVHDHLGNDATGAFLDWSVTATHEFDLGNPTGTFMGFRATPASPRTVSIRVFTSTRIDPANGSLVDPTSVWDQLTTLAQLGIRAVGRPVPGRLSWAAP